MEAVFRIAEFNLKGIGTSKSVGTAIEHYTLAAEDPADDGKYKIKQYTEQSFILIFHSSQLLSDTT